jgi:aminopeptidase N
MAAATRFSSLLEPGISHALAKWRKRHITDVRYRIDASVSPAVDALSGVIDISFSLAKRVDLIIDWRPAAQAHAAVISVNGVSEADCRFESDHLVIARKSLRAGINSVCIRFASSIALSGAGITRYQDSLDSSDYVYTLLVPADASTVFPCFDQPDLKARFTFALDVPANWQIVANAPEASQRMEGARKLVQFQETAPISTYLFAFAAGPFAILTGDPTDATRTFVRRSQAVQATAAVNEALRLNKAAVRYFEAYFAHPFPFAKYDLVLIPEFPYNGMEHAGTTFLREDAILLPAVTGAADQLRRAQLIFHETAHQWMGDLVTMRWFDDLWLKEGFANLMATKAAAEIVPELNPWVAFLHLKTNAYRTDVTAGTTPLWQAMANLSEAKSAYGSIVYSKGPAVLRQAEVFLGEEVFRQAVRAFVGRYAYDAATWKDLVLTLEESSGRDLTQWARAWITRRGLAKVSVEWSGDRELTDFTIRQENALGGRATWPQRIGLLLVDESSHERIVDMELSARHTSVQALIGTKMPSYVFANERDNGYGLFLLDARSRAQLSIELPEIRDPLRRALIWNAMWDSVRECDMAPEQFLRLGLDNMAGERDEIMLASLLANMQIAFRWYLQAPAQRTIGQSFDEALIDRLLRAPTASLRLTYFRAFTTVATSPRGMTVLKDLLNNILHIPDLPLAHSDRQRILQRLTLQGDGQRASLVDEECRHLGGDARRFLFSIKAAERDSKAQHFTALRTDHTIPEAWLEEALQPFNAPEHADVTIAYLPAALAALPALKRERKIFFVNRWLTAFIGGQHSADALVVIRNFLDTHPMLEPDLRRKVVEAAGELERTVAIRGRTHP